MLVCFAQSQLVLPKDKWWQTNSSTFLLDLLNALWEYGTCDRNEKAALIIGASEAAEGIEPLTNSVDHFLLTVDLANHIP